jgi:hypothetical protein
MHGDMRYVAVSVAFFKTALLEWDMLDAARTAVDVVLNENGKAAECGKV